MLRAVSIKKNVYINAKVYKAHHYLGLLAENATTN
jgi:hypothetical protein